MMGRMDPHLHRLPPGPVDLRALPTDDTSAHGGGKSSGRAALAALGDELSDLQERLFAERTAGSGRRVLLVLQGMDTSGKGGVLRHTVGLVDPQGVKITSFKAPTDEERTHPFLWRIRNAVPEPGYIGVFDRSHYEDVLIVRVHGLAEPEAIESRYDQINEFEAELAAEGVVIIKCMLHLSAGEQQARLLTRLDSEDKYWKFNPSDLDERARWSDYRTAYEIALERTNTEVAPWYVVPSDKK
jgi:PPK2 family polyphosphate:nucleotide phosphotransferase